MDKSQFKDMSERIKKRRKELGYTQEQTSELLGVSYSSYSKIENAFQNPSLGTVVKLSLLLKVTLDYLVFGAAERDFKIRPDLYDDMVTVLSACDTDKLEHANDTLGKLIKTMKKIQADST